MNSSDKPELEIGNFRHQEITGKVIGAFYEVYNELGQGFLESVYENAMRIALQQTGLNVQQQMPVAVFFRGQPVGEFFADLLVEEQVIVELKAARTLDSAHESQLLNYLRATQIEVGLLLNFGREPQVKRMAFDNSRKNKASGNWPQIDADERRL